MLGVSPFKWKHDKFQSSINERQYPGYYASVTFLDNQWEWELTHELNVDRDSGICTTREEAQKFIEELILKKFPKHVSFL